MERRMDKLSVFDEEEEELILDTPVENVSINNLEFYPVGRFLTDRNVNFLAMKHRLTSLWRPGKGVCIKELNPQRFLFQFFHVIDMQCVLDRGPWTFDGHLLVLH
ncbi:conserved hypothetical protein [Ricinus communis]|uniref:DUF4283 domain-containing protein n=1 Tax=Ricinus communis TaxID=3988 RepID=B9RFW1_RICCO|nr:conserved hypothetical protein [Ricinus communis]